MSNEVTPAGDLAKAPSARDAWWFSPVMWIAAGAAAVGFQWGPISGGSAKWLNWVAAIAGAALVLYGLAEGSRAWSRRHRTP